MGSRTPIGYNVAVSAAPRMPDDLGLAGLRMTAAEYFALGETRQRYELVDGVVVTSPSPSRVHQRILVALLEQLIPFMKRTGGEVLPDMDLEVNPRTVYQPDLICFARSLPDVPTRVVAPPDLVIEIFSPSTKAFDLTTKRDDYERFGVGEYWTIDPADARVRRYARQQGQLVKVPFTGDALACGALPGFTLDVRPLRELVQRP